MTSNLVSAAPDGTTPGNSDLAWTPQSTRFNSNKNLVSSPGQLSFGMGDASGQGYFAWSMDPTDAQTIASVGTTATSFGWLTKVFCTDSGTSTFLDIITATGTPATITGCVFALYSSSSFSTGPLAYTASVTQTTLTTGNTLYSIPWNTPASVMLQSMQPYWIYTTCTFSSTGSLTLIANSSINAIAQNANMTASSSSANNSMTLSPAPVLFSAVSASSTLTPQTGWANSANRFFFGLR